MSDFERYCKAMRTMDFNLCFQIEEQYGLAGFPPEIVTTVLKGVSEGQDIDSAVNSALSN